jgi:hypothetical protein
MVSKLQSLNNDLSLILKIYIVPIESTKNCGSSSEFLIREQIVTNPTLSSLSNRVLSDFNTNSKRWQKPQILQHPNFRQSVAKNFCPKCHWELQPKVPLRSSAQSVAKNFCPKVSPRTSAQSDTETSAQSVAKNFCPKCRWELLPKVLRRSSAQSVAKRFCPKCC